METPVNMEERIGKTVGRRKIQDGFRFGMQLQKVAGSHLRASGGGLVPKGVYRFNSHEEADEWMIKMLANRTAKISN